MSPEIMGVVGLLVLTGLMFLRVPIALCFALVGAVGTILLSGVTQALYFFRVVPFAWTNEYSFSVLPMFVLMGLVISASGVAKDLYEAAYNWFGRLPGGLAVATLVVTAIFSAISGSSVAAASTIAAVCYPQMRRYGYDKGLASGVIASGATMDIMIPPSVPMIIYALAAEVSVGKMFIAGFIPGIVEVLVFSLIIFVMVKRKPSLAPLASIKVNFMQKLKGLKSVLPILAIFLVVFGGLYGGVFTPTEAGAIGVVAAIVVCVMLRRLRARGFKEALLSTVGMTGTVLAILIGVMLFNTFVALSRLPSTLGEWVIGIGISPALFLVFVLLLYLVLGAFMEEISLMLLTIPIFMPAVRALGVDPIHFGILIILAWQIGMLAPPVGLMVFVTKSVLPDVSTGTVYRGCLPFLVGLIFVEALVVFAPDVALLPLRWMK